MKAAAKGGSKTEEKFDKTTEMCLRLIRGEETKEDTRMCEEERKEGERLAKAYSRNWVRGMHHDYTLIIFTQVLSLQLQLQGNAVLKR